MQERDKDPFSCKNLGMRKTVKRCSCFQRSIENLREIQCYSSVQSSIMGGNFFCSNGMDIKFSENLNIAILPAPGVPFFYMGAPPGLPVEPQG